MSSPKFVRFIAEITKLTSEGKIRWHRERAPTFLTHESDKSIMSFYECEIDGRRWGLHEERYEVWDEETDSNCRHSRIILALYSTDDDQEYALPSRLPGLTELYETVRYSTSKVGDAIESILSGAKATKGKKGA